VESLLRNAERILETAVVATDDDAQDCTICITHLGAIRVLAEPAGWSLPALAADLGAVALFRVERRAGQVRVEGWSPTGSCVLRRSGHSPRSGMLGGFEKRPCATSAEFVTAEPHDRASIAGTGDTTSHDQFERTSVLQQKRPRNVRLHISARGRGIICQKKDSTPAQLGGYPRANAKRAFFIGVVEAELQLDVITPVDSPISLDDLYRHRS
jgi:hypothetical protein